MTGGIGYIERWEISFGKPNKDGRVWANCVTFYTRDGRMIRIKGSRLRVGECDAMKNPEMRPWPLSPQDEERAETLRRARRLAA